LDDIDGACQIRQRAVGGRIRADHRHRTGNRHLRKL